MRDRANVSALIARFTALHQSVLHFIEQCPAHQWRNITAEEGWRVGVTVHHIGAIHYPVIDQVQAMLEGKPLTVSTMADVDRRNDLHVREYAECTAAQTFADLVRAGDRVQQWLQTISDADLTLEADIPFMGGRTTAARLLRVVLIELSDGHLSSAREASGAQEVLATSR